jgi:hypothetical protein
MRGWNLDALSAAGNQARDNARVIDDALDRAERALANASSWFGMTHDAATAKIEQEVDHGHELSNVYNQISDNADDAARELGNVRSAVLAKADQAVAAGFTVSDNGAVTHPDETRAGDAEQYQRFIQSHLDEADRLDTSYGAALRTSAKDLNALVHGQPDVTLPSGEVIDPDALVDRVAAMKPDERAAFMATLDPETLHAMEIADPEQLARLDGVPFDVRIASNELNIRNALTDELQKVPPDQARVDQLNAMLGTIDDPLIPGDQRVDRQFVMFSTEGNGRMIEVIGTIQPGVQGVGVVVPGTNTNLNGSGSNHKSAVELARESESPVFLYIDGDFPQGLDKAADPKYAADIAPRLVEFGKEIDREVARSAPGTAVTYIGHSYGGAIVGTAEQLGLRADRIVHASSAGTGIFPTGYANPNPDVQRFSMTAPGDPIGAIQSLPRDTDLSDIPGADRIPGIPHNVEGRIGNPLGGLPDATDPDEIPGVTRLDTGYYGEQGRHPNEVIVGPDGHGSYWDDPGSDAFQNLAAVVGGGEATAYVERGIETNAVDIRLGDDGNFNAELSDQLGALAAQQSGKIDLPWPLPDPPAEWDEPWDGPRVSDNPQHGRRFEVQ